MEIAFEIHWHKRVYVTVIDDFLNGVFAEWWEPTFSIISKF